MRWLHEWFTVIAILYWIALLIYDFSEGYKSVVFFDLAMVALSAALFLYVQGKRKAK